MGYMFVSLMKYQQNYWMDCQIKKEKTGTDINATFTDTGPTAVIS